MVGTAWLAPLAGSGLVRRMADAGFVKLAHRRVHKLDALNLAQVQHDTLMALVRRAADTKFGRDYSFADIRSPADYRARVPIRDYEAFWQQYWKDAYPRLQGVTWPDAIPYYALSSGTTTGATKFIPVSWDMVKSNRKAALTTMALFRHAHPQTKTFTGKFFFVGGTTDLRAQADGSLAGDLSGIAAKEVEDFMRPYVYPSLELSLITDWETKMKRLATEAVREPISAISGVPSWMIALFDRMMQLTGKKTVAEIWPQLRLVVHGGTKFDPYRDAFVQRIGSDAVKFCEVYPCSEGFIATEDPRHGMLRLVPDHDVFFEFVPAEDLDSSGKPKDGAARHTVAEIQAGVRYAVVVTSCAGVWAYLIGDTVTFEQTNPPLLRFSGRTKNFLSAFGEHLIEEEVEKAVAHAARACGVTTTDHHVGPVFPAESGQPGRHLYLIEFERPPDDITRFAMVLDEELVRMNEDYAAHRVGDLTMTRPEVRPVPVGGFAGWMKSRGKLGGQNKVPRMDNSGQITKGLVAWLDGSKN